MLAHKLLEKILNKKGYVKAKLTPGFWTHKWRPISFTLCVDNFGVKYVGKQHANQLMQVLSEHYTILHDWTGAKYLGIDLEWAFIKGAVHTSMLGYSQSALTRFDHPPPKSPNISLTRTSSPCTGKRCNTQRTTTTHPSSPRQTKNSSKKS